MDNSDLLMTKLLEDDNDGFMGGAGIWFWWIIIVFLFFVVSYRLNADRDATSQLNQANASILEAANSNQRALFEGNSALQREILEGQYQSLAKQAECCCGIQKEILISRNDIEREACATRNLILQQGYEMQNQMLRDKLEQRDRELIASNNALNNTVLTQNVTNTILNSLGRYCTNPPCYTYTPNPCGCGFSTGCGSCG